MSGSSRNGDFYMVSYRDPNLEKTNDIYEGAADYIRNFDVSRRDMVKFIIGNHWRDRCTSYTISYWQQVIYTLYVQLHRRYVKKRQGRSS